MPTEAQTIAAARAALAPLLRLLADLERGARVFERGGGPVRALRHAGLDDPAGASRHHAAEIDEHFRRFEAIWVRGPATVAQRFMDHYVAALTLAPDKPEQAAFAAIGQVQRDAALADAAGRYAELFLPAAGAAAPDEQPQRPARQQTRVTVPTRPADRDHWKGLWLLIKGRVSLGHNRAKDIDAWLADTRPDVRRLSLKTLERLISAGRAGLLDDGETAGRYGKRE